MRALVVGIDDYKGQDALSGCSEDAEKISSLLKRNDDEKNTPQFDCRLLTSDTHPNAITDGLLTENIDTLFGSEAECALFYFAGHGAISPGAAKGYLATPNSLSQESGVRLEYLLNKAVQGHQHNGVKSSVIILDCCNAGAFGATGYNFDPDNPSDVGKGLTLLAAADRNQAASGNNIEGGLFSRLIINALDGAAADIRGRITPAAIYAHVDQFLDKWQQRPVYKANVKEFINLRQCVEKVPSETLKMLPEWFLEEDDEYALCPECEPDISKLPEKFHELTTNKKLSKIYEQLQTCNRHGLVVPVGEKHMYDAAINSKSCKLTKLGKFYRHLAEIERI